jgi:hypothetical protein
MRASVDVVVVVRIAVLGAHAVRGVTVAVWRCLLLVYLVLWQAIGVARLFVVVVVVLLVRRGCCSCRPPYFHGLIPGRENVAIGGDECVNVMVRGEQILTVYKL